MVKQVVCLLMGVVRLSADVGWEIVEVGRVRYAGLDSCYRCQWGGSESAILGFYFTISLLVIDG